MDKDNDLEVSLIEIGLKWVLEEHCTCL